MLTRDFSSKAKDLEKGYKNLDNLDKNLDNSSNGTVSEESKKPPKTN